SIRRPARAPRLARASGRLLRRHLRRLAGRKIETPAWNAIEIGAGHADESGTCRILDRMNGALLIDSSLPGHQAVLFPGFERGALGIGAVVELLPFGHVGELRGLAVNRPGRAVIMRGRGSGLVIDMGENLKTELGILVKHVEAVRRFFAAHAADEVAIGEQAFQGHANLLPPARAGIARQRGPAIGDELLEIVRHGAFSALRAETWRIRQERASTISGPRAMFRDSGSST